MSIRPSIHPIKDIRPIRRALGSNDETLVERILAAHLYFHQNAYGKRRGSPEAAEVRDLRKSADDFVAGRFAGEEEPGHWMPVVDHLARALGMMQVTALPTFGEWKLMSWYDYAAEVGASLDEPTSGLLAHLARGRSLSGRPMGDGQGTFYAWLDRAEVRQLAAGLRGLPERPDRSEDDDWLAESHEELVDCLAECRGKSLLLLA